MFWQSSYRIRYFVRSIARNVRTQPNYNDSKANHARNPSPRVSGFQLATPRQLVEYLNQYIVGQEHAKKVLSVAVFNHYSRAQANQAILEQQQRQTQVEFEQNRLTRVDLETGIQPAQIRPIRSQSLPTPSQPIPLPAFPLFEKSNVLVIGPTGSGMNFKWLSSSAHTQTFWIGKTLLAKTLARVLDLPFSASDATSFTQAGYVGEDVDMAIQRLLQDSEWDPDRASMGIVYIDEIDKIARKTASGTDGSRDVSGEGVQQALLRMMEGSVISVQAKAKPDMYHIDTSNVLFIVSGAFVGLDNIIRQRVSKRPSIGFSSTSPSSTSNRLFFTPNQQESENILENVDPSDLVKYGFIPEFIARLPSITTLAPLTIPDLRRILTGVKGSLLSQYRALFEYSNVEIRFTSAALDEICRKAYERGGGARGLRGIMERLLLEPMYEVPGSEIQAVLITEKVVKGEASPQYWRRSDGSLVAFWKDWAAEETEYDKRNPNSKI
ncbi:P-loop containing nucleoside triphosphate hydrolase protein [Rhodocollybia butyracea]|uniref:P-loop containing nucleoside triphosphate hydrolase protein n=1 Tax=Rhodocollybia butyracea TaxID=206335 RepID=A0A9P5Q7A2_9AGAR|nr:P-loop containing nucleoside triphosphate hydrolase protein [Rhodocollybia butyracea]